LILCELFAIEGNGASLNTGEDMSGRAIKRERNFASSADPSGEIARAAAKVSGRRICRLNIGRTTVWLKDFNEPSPPKWEGLQRAASRMTRLQLLRPVPSGEGAGGARREIEAIRQFHEIGVRVPDVLWTNGGKVAISDIGETLRDLERRSGAAAISNQAALAAKELARVHSHGLVHGRPILRNLTWDGDRIGFIDFEENSAAVMSLSAAQARDVLLLIVSIGRRGAQEAVETALEASAATMQREVAAELVRAVRLARPLGGAIGDMLLRGGNRDLIGIVQAVRAVSAARLPALAAAPDRSHQ